jgi:L-Ala-D/L-Glu epimerase
VSKILSLEGLPYRLPLHGELAWGAHSRLSAAEHVLVRVHLEDGTLGEAEAPPRPTIYGETVASILGILAHLEGSFVGLDIEDTAALEAARGSVTHNLTARGALDMALWDARFKARGQTLFGALLGPSPRVRVSYILGIAAPDTMLDEARRVVAQGVRVLKVKVGRHHTRDLEVIAALKAEFGDDVALYADSNETLTPELAAAALDAMRAAGLMYVEEPLPIRLLPERQALKASGRLPIVADDSCFTPADLDRELRFDTFDVLNIKTARNGFTDSLTMLARAQAARKGVMIGSQASSGLGTLHAALISTQAGVTEPCELSFVLKVQADLLNAPIEFKDGYLDVPALAAHRIDAEKLRAARF